MFLLSISLFWGMGTGLAHAETTTSDTTPDVVITTNETGTPIVTSSSPETTPPVVVEPTPTVTPPVVKAPVVVKPVQPGGGASPATEAALKSTVDGTSIEIQPIPIGDFVNHVEKKMFEVVMGIRRFSIPYAIFVLTIGGLVLMIPFKMPMQKALGFGIIGFGLLGFVLIWFSPVLLGIAQSMTQP